MRRKVPAARDRSQGDFDGRLDNDNEFVSLRFEGFALTKTATQRCDVCQLESRYNRRHGREQTCYFRPNGARGRERRRRLTAAIRRRSLDVADDMGLVTAKAQPRVGTTLCDAFEGDRRVTAVFAYGRVQVSSADDYEGLAAHVP